MPFGCATTTPSKRSNVWLCQRVRLDWLPPCYQLMVVCRSSGGCSIGGASRGTLIHPVGIFRASASAYSVSSTYPRMSSPATDAVAKAQAEIDSLACVCRRGRGREFRCSSWGRAPRRALAGLRVCPGEDIHAAAIGDHQSGLAQPGQVVADGAVGEVQDRSPLGPHAGAELPGWMPLGPWLSGGGAHGQTWPGGHDQTCRRWRFGGILARGRTHTLARTPTVNRRLAIRGYFARSPWPATPVGSEGGLVERREALHGLVHPWPS